MAGPAWPDLVRVANVCVMCVWSAAVGWRSVVGSRRRVSKQERDFNRVVPIGAARNSRVDYIIVCTSDPCRNEAEQTK